MRDQGRLLIVSHLLRHNIAALRAFRRVEPANLSVLLNVPAHASSNGTGPDVASREGLRPC